MMLWDKLDSSTRHVDKSLFLHIMSMADGRFCRTLRDQICTVGVLVRHNVTVCVKQWNTYRPTRVVMRNSRLYWHRVLQRTIFVAIRTSPQRYATIFCLY